MCCARSRKAPPARHHAGDQRRPRSRCVPGEPGPGSRRSRRTDRVHSSRRGRARRARQGQGKAQGQARRGRLTETLADDERFRRRFLREARLAGRLSDPHVVQVYDAGETNGRPFIVMEYVAGRTLAESGKLPADETLELGLQACAGLQHAHDAGLVHRDVKPGNLLLRDDGVLKIADFGIARAAETTRVTELGTVLGTAAYLSPEQAAGEEVTAAADIYSLAAVLYELLTGRPPYQFESLAELAAKQSAGVITPVRDLEPSVPPQLEAAVMHALAREPRFRPASAAEFAQELAQAVEPPTEPLPATAVTERARGRIPRLVPGRKAWVWFAGAAAVAVF